jgi:chromosome segregation ATPase
MDDTAENTASRLWRDRAHVREQERNEAQARARVAEGKVAALTAENDRLTIRNTQLGDQNARLEAEIARLASQKDQLSAEIARLRSLTPDAARAHSETDQQMEALRAELASLIDQPAGSSRH